MKKIRGAYDIEKLLDGDPYGAEIRVLVDTQDDVRIVDSHTGSSVSLSEVPPCDIVDIYDTIQNMSEQAVYCNGRIYPIELPQRYKVSLPATQYFIVPQEYEKFFFGDETPHCIDAEELEHFTDDRNMRLDIALEMLMEVR